MELILALKGAAAGILETIPTNRRNNYNELMVAGVVPHGAKVTGAKGKRTITSLYN